RISVLLLKNADRTGISRRSNSKRHGSRAARNSFIRTAKRTSKLSASRIKNGQPRTMKSIKGYFLITPNDLHWRPSNLMNIPNADFLERTKSENLGARLLRLPRHSATTLHKHIRAEEFYFVLEGVGRMRLGDETLTVPKYGGVLVGPDQLRQCSTIRTQRCSGLS